MPVDLRTSYLGLELECPIVASSSPLTGSLSSLRDLVDAGVGAVVLPSLFEEELVKPSDEHAADVLWSAEDDAGAASAYMALLDKGRLDAYLDLVRDARRELDVPVIASLNGSTPGGWTKTAELLQQAGAHAIELNVYGVESDRNLSAGAVEDRTLRLVHAVRHVVSIPIAVKLSPFYTAFASFARDLAETRVDGFVLFNRFLQPVIDLDTLEVRPEITLSRREELRLALRWIAILRGRVSASLAATGGVHGPDDAVQAILVGADVAMMASSLMIEGARRIEVTRAGLADWLELRGHASVAEIRGRLAQESAGNPRAYERAQYVKAISSLAHL
jgi:dihydroorotate dehydrogenase (fumarate)